MPSVTTIDIPPKTAQAERPQHYCIPENSRRELAVAVAIAVLSSLYLMAFRSLTSLIPDEGISLQAAERILHGQVVYRDFFSLVTPGSYYWTALLFKVFGDSILVARSALVIYGGVFSLLLYLLARRVCSRKTAAIGAGLLTITCLPYYFVSEHNWDSTFWACLALYCAVRLLERPNPRWAFAVGGLTAVTCLFEQSKGAGLLLGLAAGFILAVRPGNGQKAFTRKHVAAAVVGFALPFVITLAYFGLKHGLAPALADWFWPLQHYNSVNRVRYGFLPLSPSEWHTLHSGSLAWKSFLFFTLSPTFLLPVLPILALLILARSLLNSQRGWAQGAEHRYYLLVSSSIAGLWLSLLAARPGFSHITFLGPIFFIVLCWVLEGKAFGGTSLPAARRPLSAYVVLSFSAFALALLIKTGAAHVPLLSRRGTLKTEQRDEVVNYVQAHIPKGGRIFVYPYQPLYYYLSGTVNPTSYDLIYDGFNTPAQIGEAVHQLKADRTPAVLITPSFSTIAMTDFPGTPLSVLARPDPMLAAISSRYRGCRSLQSAEGFSYVFMVRKDLACPADSDSK